MRKFAFPSLAVSVHIFQNQTLTMSSQILLLCVFEMASIQIRDFIIFVSMLITNIWMDGFPEKNVKDLPTNAYVFLQAQ